MTDLTGKHGLIVGVANKRSIAWAIAVAAGRAGARLAVTYQGERLEENVRELSAALDAPLILPCDVTDDAQIANVFSRIGEEFGGLDFVVHGAAYAPREELTAPFVQTSRAGFTLSLDVSAYSLIALARGARGVGALSRGRPRTQEHSRERHISRTDQDPGGVGHLGLLEHSAGLPGSRAAPPHDRNRRGRRRRALPARPCRSGRNG